MSKFLAILLFFLVYLHESSCEKIIIDTDAGGDDAIAILLLLRHEAFHSKSELEIIGITCTHGNTEEENVEVNVLKTLTIANRSDIPVYGGAKKGLLEPFSSDYPYGKDGFGDEKFDQEIIAQVDKSKHAALALVDMAKKNAGNISVIAIGPLTNLALAIALDGNFTRNVNRFYVMGASVAGVGNRRPNVEFNIGGDPEGAFILFNATSKSQITLFPWETALSTSITKDWRREVLGKYKSPYMEFLNKVESKSYSAKRKQWVTADAILAASLLEPLIIENSVVKNVHIVTQGDARGSALIDYTNKTNRTENAKIVQATSDNLYQKILIRYLTCEEIAC